MKKFIVGLFILCAPGVFAQRAQWPYQDKTLPVEKRVSDLLGRMSLHEKIMQMQHLVDFKGTEQMNGMSYGCAMNTDFPADSAAIIYKEIQDYCRTKTRWGIPILPCTEAIHGAYQGNCTIFPHAIAQGSTFNPDLVKRMVASIATELKAMNIKQILSPDLDIARELRWGRVEETFGEDPFLIGEMGVAYVKTAEERGIICTPKHFIAHGTPTNGINISSVSGGERDLRMLYLPPFEKVIRQAHPLSIMNCYSTYDHVPIAGSHYYLTQLLRDELGFDGYVYSDWGSVAMLNFCHRTAADNTEAGVMALKAGIDVEASGNCYLNLEQLVNENKFDVRYIDQAVGRILRVKFISGLFDQPVNPSVDMKKAIHSKESVALAKEIADESIILLKNQDGVLPLDLSKYKSIAVVGPNADVFQPGDYSWTRHLDAAVTPLEGIRNWVGSRAEIHFAPGCTVWSQNRQAIPMAVEAARQSDLVIAVVGTEGGTFTDQRNVTSGEGYDLSDITLPGVQQDLLKEVKATGKPLIVVLVAGKPLALPWVKEQADAVLVQWYGGEQQGAALADVLFGKVNPSGRLNVSFPQSTGHLPCYYNYLPSDKGYYHSPGTLEKPGRDYVFSSPAALWNFGYGLSYTTFTYTDAQLKESHVTASDTVHVQVTVKNTGRVDGKEVVQVYVKDLAGTVETPVKQLKAFRKELVKAGEVRTIDLQLPVSDWFLYDDQMKRVVEPGTFEIQIGAASDDIRFKKQVTVTR